MEVEHALLDDVESVIDSREREGLGEVNELRRGEKLLISTFKCGDPP